MYQQSPATVTVTASGQPVVFAPDYTTRTVAVYVAGEHRGTWPNRTAAREALGLVEEPVRKTKRAGR